MTSPALAARLPDDHAPVRVETGHGVARVLGDRPDRAGHGRVGEQALGVEGRYELTLGVGAHLEVLAEDAGAYGQALPGDGEVDGPGHRGLRELPHGPSGLLGPDVGLGALDGHHDGGCGGPQVGLAEGGEGPVLDEGDALLRGDGLRRALLEGDRPVAGLLTGGRADAVDRGPGGLLVHPDHRLDLTVSGGEEPADDGGRSVARPDGVVHGRGGVEREPERGGGGLLHVVADLHRDRGRGGGPELPGQRLPRLPPAHSADVHSQDARALVDVAAYHEPGDVEAAPESQYDGAARQRQGDPSVAGPVAHASHVSPTAPTGQAGGAGPTNDP